MPVGWCDGFGHAQVCGKVATPPKSTDWDWLDGGAIGITLRNPSNARRDALIGAVQAAGLEPRFRLMQVERHPRGGVVGCFDSHQKACRQFLEAGARTGLVLEDDARPNRTMQPSAVRALGSFMQALGTSRPVVVQLGYVAHPMPFLTRLGDDDATRRFGQGAVRRLDRSFMTHAVLLNRPAMEQVVRMDPTSTTYDDALVNDPRYAVGLTRYCVDPQMFYQCEVCGTDVTPVNDIVQKVMGMQNLQALSEFYARHWLVVGTAMAVWAIAFLALGIAVVTRAWSGRPNWRWPMAAGAIFLFVVALAPWLPGIITTVQYERERRVPPAPTAQK